MRVRGQRKDRRGRQGRREKEGQRQQREGRGEGERKKEGWRGRWSQAGYCDKKYSETATPTLPPAQCEPDCDTQRNK